MEQKHFILFKKKYAVKKCLVAALTLMYKHYGSFSITEGRKIVLRYNLALFFYEF